MTPARYADNKDLVTGWSCLKAIRSMMLAMQARPWPKDESVTYVALGAVVTEEMCRTAATEASVKLALDLDTIVAVVGSSAYVQEHLRAQYSFAPRRVSLDVPLEVSQAAEEE